MQQLFWTLGQQTHPRLYSSGSSPQQDITFFELERYIRSHTATVTANELTNLFHYDRNYFNRLIKARTGLTYSQYLRRLRLEEAKRLLVETRLPVQEICRQIGYENRSFFYRIFQAETGLPPQEYRRQAGKE